MEKILCYNGTLFTTSYDEIYSISSRSYINFILLLHTDRVKLYGYIYYCDNVKYFYLAQQPA